MPRPPVKKKKTAPRRTSMRGSAVSSTKRNSTVPVAAAPSTRKQTTNVPTTPSASSSPSKADASRRTTRSSIGTATHSSTRRASGRAKPKPDAIAAAAAAASKQKGGSRKRTSTDANSSKQNEEPSRKSAKRRRVVEEEEEAEAEEEVEAPRPAPPKKTKKKPARTSNAQVEIHFKRNNDAPNSGDKTQWDVEEDSADDEYKIPGLKPRVRKISAATVEAKWSGLSENIQGDILNMLQGISKQVLTSFRSDKQRAEAQVVLNQLSQKFERRLQRYIAPPGKDYSFNLEKIMDENNKLESLLEPYNKQIADLEATLERETTAYDKDIDRLDELRKNAESEASLRSRQQQSLHSCLKYGPKKDVSQLERSTASLRLVDDSNRKKEMNSEFTLAEDDKLFTTVKRLQNHLLSMQQNSNALGGIPDQLQKTRAYVDDILYQTNMHEKIMGVSL